MANKESVVIERWMHKMVDGEPRSEIMQFNEGEMKTLIKEGWRLTLPELMASSTSDAADPDGKSASKSAVVTKKK